jgi:hypothetical protein
MICNENILWNECCSATADFWDSLEFSDVEIAENKM